jgi:hypothetical protein
MYTPLILLVKRQYMAEEAYNVGPRDDLMVISTAQTSKIGKVHVGLQPVSPSIALSR